MKWESHVEMMKEIFTRAGDHLPTLEGYALKPGKLLFRPRIRAVVGQALRPGFPAFFGVLVQFALCQQEAIGE